MRWLRRFVYFLLFFLWLAIMFFPCMAFTLSMQQQIEWGDSEGSHVRIFLLQEREKEGVGVEWKRPSGFNSNCHKTSINYLMWVGEGDNTAYCQCVDPQTGDTLLRDPQACHFP